MSWGEMGLLKREQRGGTIGGGAGGRDVGRNSNQLVGRKNGLQKGGGKPYDAISEV